jgi:capsule polysaccharide export protein KpsE/RkpR
VRLRRLKVDETELEKQLANALKSQESYRLEIERIKKVYTVLLCPKEKSECEPAYCMFQITDKCPFLDKWSFLVKKYKL